MSCDASSYKDLFIWTFKYQKEVDADKELERTLNDRLEGNMVVNEWLKRL